MRTLFFLVWKYVESPFPHLKFPFVNPYDFVVKNWWSCPKMVVIVNIVTGNHTAVTHFSNSFRPSWKGGELYFYLLQKMTVGCGFSFTNLYCLSLCSIKVLTRNKNILCLVSFWFPFQLKFASCLQIIFP